MISMQRSLSSPVRIDSSSPSVSPTASVTVPAPASASTGVSNSNNNNHSNADSTTNSHSKSNSNPNFIANFNHHHSLSSSNLNIHAKINSNPTTPLTPTTALISRSSTPSPELRVDTSRRRLHSRSPSQASRQSEPSHGVSLSLRHMDKLDRHSLGGSRRGSGASAQKKPIIAQKIIPSKTCENSSSSSSSFKFPPSALKNKGPPTARRYSQPLINDVTQYTNPHLTLETEGTSLEELAHLVRLSKYQERKRANTRIRLQRSLVSTALSARLTRCGEITQRNLADSFRHEDKKAFSSLFGAMHDVRNSCDAARRYALLEPEMEPLQSSGGPQTPTRGIEGMQSNDGSVTPFLNDISASAREAFLDFLTQLRTNPNFLASRLCALNNSELQALATFHQGLEPVESVLPYYTRPSEYPRSSGRAGSSNTGKTTPANSTDAVTRLLSFQRHDALSALIYTVFANSAGPDSAEDKRRTDIWANACARLISEAKGNSFSQTILTSVINVWASMRDWSGRSNMEWYIMKMLEDGAFLLDRAEDSNGTRFNISEWTQKDNIAADEFYDRAINELFEIIDDEDATGIPEGLIELGNEILRRLDSKFVEYMRKWFVYKWLFSTWLLSVLIHPESYGMMSEYHITEYGRQKILKQIAQRAQHLVVEMLNNNNPKRPVSTPSKVKGHVENIVNRFKPSRTQRTGRLLPARSITSLRETVEVHPYLVISPADLLTLVNALFPERRPRSTHSSIRSGAPSISGLSSLSQSASASARNNNFETASVVSFSASSVMSDSKDTLVEEENDGDETPQRYSPPIPEFPGASTPRSLSSFEDEGYRLRLALHEMVQVLGNDVVSGACHPCAERWAVLFISADGKSLSMQMTYDPDEDPEEENSSTTSDTEDDEANDRPELDKDYHQLRDSVLKLVEDFEIPQGLEDDGSKTTFSNRASGLKRYKSKNKIVTTESSMGSRNPYRKREEERLASRGDSSASLSKGKEPDTEPEVIPVLITMLQAASSQSRVQSDFVSAHLYWRTLQQLNALASPSLRRNGFSALLNIFSRGPKDSIRRSAAAIEEYDAWLVWLKQSQERHEGLIDSMMKRLRSMRDKMWYVTDVHNSAPYEHTRSICSALKIMGVPRRWGNFQRTRAQLARGPAVNYWYKNESQMLDLLAAGEEQGGPNKLSDDQAEKTTKWLEQFGVENLCRGEERIHRFSCEIDSCINKLVGDNIVDGPVLWASELYLRDRKMLEGHRPPKDSSRDSIWSGDDSSSVISDMDRGRYAMSPGARPRSVTRDIRAMTTHNVSQLSLDSGRYSYSRASTAMSDILDSQEYFGHSSPVHAIDSSHTFYSPFQSTMPSASSVISRAQSPTTSITNFSGSMSIPYQRPVPSVSSSGRPGTSTSSNETVQAQRLSEDKQRFLDELRQTLTSLLISDLGNYVFAIGSETDSWFDGLGQECIERRALQERRTRRPTIKKERPSRNSPKLVMKRRSFGNLRAGGEHVSVDSNTDSTETMTAQSHDSGATNDSTRSRGRMSSAIEASEFPYKKAYKRLLGMFSVHPNPITKLNALYELQQLIVASLSSGTRRTRRTLRFLAAQEEENATASNIKVLEQTIENFRERRSHLPASPLQSRAGGNTETRSAISPNAGNTGSVSDLLQSLFWDANIRPKTLFRDLQFIAAFVPPHMLDGSEKGKAFWDTGLAALSLKQEVCRTMVEVADEVVKNHTQRKSVNDDLGDSLRAPLPYQMADAARMWTITAKEGDPTAQRELALFNLSNPELVERSTLPLCKPREVFKQPLMEKYGASGRSGGTRHPGERRGNGGLSSSRDDVTGKDGDVRNDPALMCVAIHWMEAAEQGGDELARAFLGQNEMMGMA